MKRVIIFLLMLLPLLSGGEWERTNVKVKPFSFTPPKVTAFAPVQVSTPTSGTSQNPTHSFSPTAGNLVIVWIRSAGTVNSVTDNIGNTYVVISHTTGTERGAYCLNPAAGVTTITVNFAANSVWAIMCQEFSGGPFVFDTNAQGSTVAGDTPINLNPDLFPSQAGCLIVCSVAINLARTFTQPTGYTMYGGASNPTTFKAAYLLSGTTSEASDWTFTGGGGASGSQIAMAFRASVVPNVSNFFFNQ